MRHAEANLADVERDVTIHLDDLDTALILLASVSLLYPRMAKKQRAMLLQILAKRIIVSADGEMIDHELHSPFAYLTELVTDLRTTGPNRRGSKTVRLPQLVGPDPNPLDMPVERFLAMLRFEQKDKLADLPLDLVELSLE